MLLDELDREEQRVKERLRVSRELAATTGGAGPIARSVERLESDLETLDTISTRLFGAVNPPALRGVSTEQRPRCRRCRSEMDSREAFYSVGLICTRCRRVSTTNDDDAPAVGLGGLLDALLG
jgi:hypothetical protein